MKKYREVFCREEGFDHVSRYVSGLVLCENKTLQGIYAQQVWPEGEEVTRRAMHAGALEVGGQRVGGERSRARLRGSLRADR